MGAARRENDRYEFEARSLCKEPVSREECIIVRNGAGMVRDFSEGCFKVEDLIFGETAKVLEAMIATAEPGASSLETAGDTGGKWYYILEGKLEVLVNDTCYLLGEGDSLYLASAASHVWRNPTDTTVKALVLRSPL